MKKLLKISTFRAIFLAAMSLFLYINNTNAQSSATPGTARSIINGYIVPTFIKVTKGDTVTYWYGYAPDTSFAGETIFQKKAFTRDTTVYDTFTVKKNGLPTTDTTGYDLITRLWRALANSKDTGFVKPYQIVTIYPVPLPIKIYNIKMDGLPNGGVLSFFGRSGSQYDTTYISYSYTYNGDTLVRKPNPSTSKFVGNVNVSQKLTGLFSSRQKVKLRISMKNSVDTFYAVLIFDTPASSNKPVADGAVVKSVSYDSVVVALNLTSFNTSTKGYCINTVNKDTLIKTILSPKTETLVFRIGKLIPNTGYTLVFYGTNIMGTGNKVSVMFTTPPKPVTPTFTALAPEVRWDYTNLVYYINPKMDGVTNSTERIKRIDLRIYTDSLYQSVPMVYKISDAQSGLTGPFNGPRIDSDSGRFWYEYVVETTNSIFTSNLLGYNVGWNYVPKIIVPTLEITSVSIGSGSVTVNWKWTSDKDNLLTGVDAKVYKDVAKTIQVYTKQILTGSSLAKTSGTGSFNIALDTGTFWVNLTGQSQLGSSPMSTQSKFQIKFTAGITKIVRPIGPIECKVYSVASQLLGTYTIDPKVNLFSELPSGVYIARPIGNYAPFKVFNHQEGGKNE